MRTRALGTISLLAIMIAAIGAAGIPAIVVAQESKGDSWSSINSALGNIEKLTGKNDTATQSALQQLAIAKSEYDTIFRPSAAELDPTTEQLVESAFADLKEAVEAGQLLNVTLNKQVVDKTIYKIAFMKIEEKILEKEIEEAAEWFTVMSKKFNYAENPSNASKAFATLEADPSTLNELGPVILEDLRATFLLKVKEEITEALEAQGKQPPDNASAQKFAIEGISYYRTIQPDVKKKLGDEQEATLFHELEEFFENAQAGNLTKMNEEAKGINALLLAYEGKETTGIGAAISEIIDLLGLVNIEYIDAVRDGQIINQEEYEETILFISRAEERFEAVKTDLLKIDGDRTTEVENDLSNLTALVQNKDDTLKVSDRVQHAQSELQAILNESGSAVGGTGGWEYIDKIKELLDQAVIEYKEGSYDEARRLARQAYIDNYEFIEMDIEQDNRMLMLKIENDLREELVKMIDERKSNAEIESHVDMIKTDLEIARAIVTPEFSFASGLIVASVAVLTGTFYVRKIRTP